MSIEIHPTAKNVVDEWVQKISDSKHPFITGIYLTGSTALGDYHPDKSDIDFLVVCNETPDKALCKYLADVHRAIEHKYKIPRLNGSYITEANLNINNSNIKTLHRTRIHLLSVTCIWAK